MFLLDFLFDICVLLAEFVLRLAPKKWQRAVEPDSAVGLALGLVIVFAALWALVAVLNWARS